MVLLESEKKVRRRCWSSAHKEFATIPTKIQRRLILKVIPRDPDPDTPVFDHRPAKTVKTQLKTWR
ncbi:hypothetical protein JL721_7532 [Aureococcus anophagefferens]|nr:hypothetical protein JL721_7532 [Aureococcus anophagefferens]